MYNNLIIGNKIKNYRESNNITVEEMSERSGLSTEQIKSIESNKDFPSLAPLIKIARVLGVRLGTFLDDQTHLGPVIHRSNNTDNEKGIGFTNNSITKHKFMTYHTLAQDKSGRNMEPFLVDIVPSNEEEFNFSSHEGEEFIYVLKGIVEINYGKNTYILNEGDSIYYDSIVAHHVHASKNKSATILGVIYTPY